MNSENKNTKAEALRRFITAPAFAGALSFLCLCRECFRPVSGMGGGSRGRTRKNNMKNKTILMTLGLTVTLALPVAVLCAQEKHRPARAARARRSKTVSRAVPAACARPLQTLARAVRVVKVNVRRRR